MTYLSVESWLKEKFSEAKRILKDWLDGKILWKDFKIHLVNTTEGNAAYFSKTGKSPILDATSTLWDSEYGSFESYNNTHFIFLNTTLVSNWIEGDVLSTMIHELLHILFPTRPEEEVKAEEKAICQRYGIVAEKSLE